jgi:transposase
VWAALQAQTVTVATEARLGQVIAELAGELDRLHTRRDRLAADIEAVFSAHPLGPVLTSLPGIGPRTGAKILAEIGYGHRFASGAQLAAYAGLAPVTHQSGSSIRGESRGRRGNHRLKNAMLRAAFCSLRHAASKAFYARKRAQGKRHNAAVICLARRRCDVILAMLKTATPYGPDRTARPSEKSTLAA